MERRPSVSAGEASESLKRGWPEGAVTRPKSAEPSLRGSAVTARIARTARKPRAARTGPARSGPVGGGASGGGGDEYPYVLSGRMAAMVGD